MKTLIDDIIKYEPCDEKETAEKQMILVLADDGSMGAYEKASSLRGVYTSIDNITMSLEVTSSNVAR